MSLASVPSLALWWGGILWTAERLAIRFNLFIVKPPERSMEVWKKIEGRWMLLSEEPPEAQ